MLSGRLRAMIQRSPVTNPEDEKYLLDRPELVEHHRVLSYTPLLSEMLIETRPPRGMELNAVL